MFTLTKNYSESTLYTLNLELKQRSSINMQVIIGKKNSKGDYLDLGREQIPQATPILYVKYHLRYFEKNNFYATRLYIFWIFVFLAWLCRWLVYMPHVVTCWVIKGLSGISTKTHDYWLLIESYTQPSLPCCGWLRFVSLGTGKVASQIQQFAEFHFWVPFLSSISKSNTSTKHKTSSSPEIDQTRWFE